MSSVLLRERKREGEESVAVKRSWDGPMVSFSHFLKGEAEELGHHCKAPCGVVRARLSLEVCDVVVTI